ncbi:MAG TPA: PD-(D/E)XK nuclease family protein [Anaeromyxobacteraceae bacterium]|nr:PD-(D/E)XK nuclease family protein [Anaeromyxobacteraceae bacterium]
MATSPARLHLILGTDPRLLLEHAAAEFLTPQHATPENPFPSPPVVLALRQGGLRDDLLALAHERGVGGWYDPPLLTFQELPKWMAATARRPLGELERRTLLERLVREQRGILGGLRHPDRFVHALDRLVGELVREEVSPDAFGGGLAARADRDDFEQRRDDELAAVYRAYDQALESTGRRDGRDTWADCARALAESPEAFTKRLAGRRELRLFGLQDLSGGWRPLLRALRACPALDRITIYSAERLPLDPDLEATVTRLEEHATVATRLFTGEPGPPDASVDLIAAPDVEREVEEVARRVRALADAGVPFHRMAVVTRQARPHADLAAEALARFGVPVTQRRRHTLREIPVVRALAALLAAAAEGWTRHGLAELADQPYFANELDAGAINAIGYERRVTGLDAWVAAFLASGSDARAAAFTRFAERASELDRPRPLAAWTAWLGRFLVEDPWGLRSRIEAMPGTRVDVVRLDLQGWKGLTKLAGQWSDALAAWGDSNAAMDASAFHAQLDDLLEMEVALWTPNRRGVPVLEGLAAAYRSFDHLFVVGLEGGRFPLRAPGSPLLDDAERRALVETGVPLELTAEWDRRERELFRILAAGARERLTVSYARLDPAGREVVRSPFIEAMADVASLVLEEIPPSRVLTPGIRITAGEEAAAHAAHAARVELDRGTGRLSPWNGQVERPALLERLAQRYGDDYLWSPTQLESYAKCPWAYFSSRLLGIETREDPDDEMDAATVGTVYHKALQRFYDAEVTRQGGPVLLLADDLRGATERLLVSLDAVLAEMDDTTWLGNPVMAGAKRMELRRTLTRYLAFEADTNRKLLGTHHTNVRIVRTAVARHELDIREAVLERHGVRIRYRGSVDRVEIGIDDRVTTGPYVAAVDYKTSKYGAPGGGKKQAWEEGVVLQAPLYAHALASIHPDAAVSRLEYRAIRQREIVQRLQLREYDKQAREVVDAEEGMARMEAALDAAARHVRRVRAGEFPADPPESCGCPSFCHARDICRVAGGPRDAWHR